jgi:hypothetical protein
MIESLINCISFQNSTGKVCGSWKRVPRRYRRQLRKDQLLVQITSASDGKVVDGSVAKHYGLTTEMFSGLLLPEDGGSCYCMYLYALSLSLKP